MTSLRQEAAGALTIEDPQAEKLARELATESGATVAQSVISALEDALTKVSSRAATKPLLATILEISDRCAALPDRDPRSADEILGDDAHGGLV